MAINGWKNTDNRKGFIRYRKFFDKRGYMLSVAIYPTYVTPNAKYIVLLSKNGDTFTQKPFKTKSEALKYAKSYMRKH